MTTKTATTELVLIERARAGDRLAFGQLVSRHQDAVCAVTFSMLGDRAASEDAAQETFVLAWRQLDQLREPERLRAWLAGIARNVARNSTRRRMTDIVSQAEALTDSAADIPSPSDEAALREEESILWKVLEEIPELYREPLVLYYREHQSVDEVAETLDLSTDAVKQRLSRGRQALKAQVVEFIERTLRRTGPTAAFTANVIGLLEQVAGPGAAVAAVGAVAGVAPKGAAMLLTGAGIGVAGAVMGSAIGVAGAAYGTAQSIRATKSPRERAFMIRMAIVFTLGVLALLAIQLTTMWLWPRVYALALFHVPLWGIYAVGLLTAIVLGNRRQKQIQIEDGTYVESTAQMMLPGGQMPLGAILGSLCGIVVGSGTWLVVLTLLARDWVCFAIVLAVTAGVFIAALVVGSRVKVAAQMRVLMLALLAMAVLNVAVVGLRWDAYLLGDAIPLGQRLPSSYVLALLGLLFGALGLMLFFQARWLARLVARSSP